MANKNITLKRNNAGTIDVLYPKTIPAQVDGLLTGGKISTSLLPDSVFDSLRFFSTINANMASTGIAEALASAYHGVPAGRSLIGTYFVVSTAGTIQNINAIQPVFGDYTDEYYTLVFRNSEGSASLSTVTSSGALEVGDWFVIEQYSGSGDSSGNPIVITASIINNTYESASETVKGIVELATNDEVAAGTDTSRAVTPAGLAHVLSDYSLSDTINTYSISTDNDATHDVKLVLTGTDNLAGTNDTTDNIYFDAGNNVSITQSNDTITISATDTTYTIAAAQDGANANIELNDGSTDDIVTLVAGDNITLTVNGDNITIDSDFTDTTYTAGNGIDISVENVISVSEATTTEIGGVTLGFTSTETNRALQLSSGKAYVNLPRQIPAVTLNGSSTTTPSFYAATTSGAQASTSQVKQALVAAGSGNAPTWVDSPVIYWNTTTGTTHGDIIFDDDNA